MEAAEFQEHRCPECDDYCFCGPGFRDAGDCQHECELEEEEEVDPFEPDPMTEAKNERENDGL